MPAFFWRVSNEGVLYVATFANAGVLACTADGQLEMVVRAYEDKPLKGPHGVALGDEGAFFSYRGVFGKTCLRSPKASLFGISSSPSVQILKLS
jgi:hypothetical protein